MLFLFLIYYEWSPVAVLYSYYFWNIFRYIHRSIYTAVTDLAFIGNAKHFPEVVVPVYTSNVRAYLAARVNICYHSVQLLSRVQLFATPWIAACQASLSITNSQSSPKLMSSSWWCHPAISSSVVPFSSCPQSLPATESFPMSQLFSWSGQRIGVSALASDLPKNTQDWSPLEWTGWISLQSKGLSRLFSNTIVQKHQLFGPQLSSQSNSLIHTWPLKKP